MDKPLFRRIDVQDRLPTLTPLPEIESPLCTLPGKGVNKIGPVKITLEIPLSGKVSLNGVDPLVQHL